MARKRDTTPRKPAATSLPGRDSSRTDGGASQPIRVASGQPYGSRQAQVAQQQAAPLPTGPPTAGGATPQPQPQQPPGPSQAEQLFAPTQRPNESITAGLGGVGQSILPPNPDMALQIMAAVYPHPDILRLLDDATS